MSIWPGASIYLVVCSRFLRQLEPHLWCIHCSIFFETLFAFLPFFESHFIPTSRQQKNSSSSEKQGSGTSPSDKMGIIRAEEGAQYTFPSSSLSVCGQKTLISENVPLPSLKNQNPPGSLLCLSGKHTNHRQKTNLLYVVTKLVDE